MQKNILILIITTSLASCHLGDRITPPSDAEAAFVGGSLCLTTPGRTEIQKLKGVMFEIRGESPGFTKFFKNEREYLTVKKDTCIPTFEYKFESGKAYNITLSFTPDIDSIRSDYNPNYYSTSFVVWEGSDKKKNISYIN